MTEVHAHDQRSSETDVCVLRTVITSGSVSTKFGRCVTKLRRRLENAGLFLTHISLFDQSVHNKL